jgi:hypothetical protein
MKTISKLAMERLQLQKTEAEVQGMNNVVNHIEDIIKKNSSRDNEDNYTYTHDEYTNDLKNLLWEAIVRTADYYGKNFTVEAADQFVGSFLKQISNDAKIVVGAEKALIGPHEPLLPGEKRNSE